MFYLYLLMKCHVIKEINGNNIGERVFSCNNPLSLLFILLINSNY